MLHGYDNQERPVAIADLVSLGQLEDVKKLIQSGHSVNEPDDSGNYPVIIAAEQNDLAMLKILVEAGAKVQRLNESGQNALSWAQTHQNQEMIDFIQSHSAKTTFRFGK
ncbi:MAG: ankyrin repeat domain-containing protein [Candidatus Berkiella sp.]